MANCPAIRPTFTTGTLPAKVSTTAICKMTRKGIADIVRVEFGKALGAVAALQQKRLALDDLGQIIGQVARLACKNQRRIVAQRFFGCGQRCCIAYIAAYECLCAFFQLSGVQFVAMHHHSRNIQSQRRGL